MDNEKRRIPPSADCDGKDCGLQAVECDSKDYALRGAGDGKENVTQAEGHGSGYRVKTAQLGMLLAFALILGYVESLLPLPFGLPGMKLGLANLAILLTLYLSGERDALVVNVARVLLSGFLFGNLSAILYSLSGALVSFAVMALCRRIPGFSISGVSIAGGCAHNAAQIAVAVLVTSTVQVLYYIPPLLACGALTGLCLGIAAGGVLRLLPKGRT